MKNLYYTFILAGCMLIACDKENNNVDQPVLPPEPDPTPEVPSIETYPRIKIELNESEQQIVNTTNSFAFSLYKQLQNAPKENNENILLSPFSLNIALAMLANGTQGDALKEITDATGLKGFSINELNSYYQKMTEGLKKADGGVVFTSANSMWSNKNIILKEDYVTTNKAVYNAECFEVDFANPSTVNDINKWCADNTNGKIDKILESTDASDLLYLINAIYFSAKWTNEFQPKNTKEGEFTQKDGSMATANFMPQKGERPYFRNDLFASTKLEYGNGAFYMQLILPNENYTTEQVIDQLKEPGYLAECNNRFSTYIVDLSLPRFKVTGEEDLITALQATGIKKIFTGEDNFSLITDAKMNISKIKQHTYLTVDEEGSEAAAITYEVMSGSAGPAPVPPSADFIANRPFLFMICESSTNTILFMGEVNSI